MIKLLTKVKGLLYSLSFRFEHLADKLDSIIEKRKHPVKSVMSDDMLKFFDEQVDIMTMYAAEHIGDLFPDKKTGSKVEFMEFNKLCTGSIPFTEGMGKNYGEPIYFDDICHNKEEG